MGGLKKMFSDNAEKLAKKQAAEQQRTQLAQLARDRAAADQEAASASPGAKTGRRLLTFAKETLG